MGSDKALALFQDRPLIVRAIAIATAAGLQTAIAGSRSQLAAYAPEIPDTFADAGPLGGIHAALSASISDWNLFIPVDLPLMPPSLLRCLIQRAIVTEAPITGVRLKGRLEPFPVVLHRTVASLAAQRLAAGQLACYVAWQSIPAELGSVLDAPAVENLLQCGQCSHPIGLPPIFWFRSANTPAELAALERLADSSTLLM